MNIRNKTVSTILTLGFILILGSAALAERAAIPVNVNVGKGTILKLKDYTKEAPIKSVSVANPDIAFVDVITPYYTDPSSPAQVLINGKKVGITNLIIWDNKGKTAFFDIVIAEGSKMKDLEDQIKALAPRDSIKVDLANDTIVLSGTATNDQTIAKAVQMAQAYAVASEVTTTTKYSSGLTSSESKSTGKVLNHIRIEEAQQVMLEVKVAQVDKNKLKEMGLSSIVEGSSGEGFLNLAGLAPSGERRDSAFNSTATGIAGNVPGLGSLQPLDPFQIGVVHFPSGIGVVLKALNSKGLAKLLAEPNLTVRTGEKGAFHVGTRFPVQVVSGTGANATVSVQYEDVGIRLNFAPDVLETGAIRLKVDPAEVSSITDFVRLENLVAPIIDTRTVRTSVDLKDGESLVLAGLLSEEMKKNIQKIPLLGDVPILGAIFRNTSDELREKELVFFITPRLVKPNPQGTKPELPGRKPLTPEEEREFDWIPIPKG